MVERCELAAEQINPEKDAIDVIDLRSIQPWDKEAVLASVRKTARCLIVHEDNKTAGFGAEIAATLSDECFFDLDAPLRRLTMPDIPSPHNIHLLEAAVPGVDDIVREMTDLLEL